MCLFYFCWCVMSWWYLTGFGGISISCVSWFSCQSCASAGLAPAWCRARFRHGVYAGKGACQQGWVTETRRCASRAVVLPYYFDYQAWCPAMPAQGVSPLPWWGGGEACQLRAGGKVSSWQLVGSALCLVPMAGSAWGCPVVRAEGHGTGFRSRFPAFSLSGRTQDTAEETGGGQIASADLMARHGGRKLTSKKVAKRRARRRLGREGAAGRPDAKKRARRHCSVVR